MTQVRCGRPKWSPDNLCEPTVFQLEHSYDHSMSAGHTENVALGQAKDSAFSHTLLPDNKLECLSNILHSMSRSTVFNTFTFSEVSHPATDHMQSNTEDKSIIFSDTAAGTLLTNSCTFCPSEISQMVSFLGQLWRFHPGLQHHSSPGLGRHFVLKLF